MVTETNTAEQTKALLTEERLATAQQNISSLTFRKIEQKQSAKVMGYCCTASAALLTLSICSGALDNFPEEPIADNITVPTFIALIITTAKMAYHFITAKNIQKQIDKCYADNADILKKQESPEGKLRVIKSALQQSGRGFNNIAPANYSPDAKPSI